MASHLHSLGIGGKCCHSFLKGFPRFDMLEMTFCFTGGGEWERKVEGEGSWLCDLEKKTDAGMMKEVVVCDVSFCGHSNGHTVYHKSPQHINLLSSLFLNNILTTLTFYPQNKRKWEVGKYGHLRIRKSVLKSRECAHDGRIAKGCMSQMFTN